MNLTINSGNDTTIVASNVAAISADIEATGNFNLLSAQDEYHSDQKSKTKGGFFGGASEQQSTSKQINTVKSELNIDEKLNLKTQNTNLIASQIQAQTLEIQTQILNLISQKDLDYLSQSSDNSGLITRKIKNKGHQKEEIIEASIQAQDITLNGEKIDNVLEPTNLENNLIKQLSSQQELIKQLQDKGINLQSLTANNKEWNESITTLSAAGQLITQALVGYFTAGMGAGLVQAGSAATQASVDAAINSLINQATSQLATAAITGNPPSFDINSMVKGAVMAGVSSYGLETFNPEGVNQVLAKASIGGIGSELTGGDFQDGFIQSGLLATAGETYKQVVGFEPQGKGDGVALKEDGMGAVEGVNNIGLALNKNILKRFSTNINDPNLSQKLGVFSLNEGSYFSNTLNNVPFINDTAGFHDSLFKKDGVNFEFNGLNNIATMLPSAIISIGAQLDNNPTPYPMLENLIKNQNQEIINEHKQTIQETVSDYE